MLKTIVIEISNEKQFEIIKTVLIEVAPDKLIWGYGNSFDTIKYGELFPHIAIKGGHLFISDKIPNLKVFDKIEVDINGEYNKTAVALVFIEELHQLCEKTIRDMRAKLPISNDVRKPKFSIGGSIVAIPYPTGEYLHGTIIAGEDSKHGFMYTCSYTQNDEEQKEMRILESDIIAYSNKPIDGNPGDGIV